MLHPELQGLEALCAIRGNAAEVAKPVVGVHHALVEVHFVEPEAGQVGPGSQASLAGPMSGQSLPVPGHRRASGRAREGAPRRDPAIRAPGARYSGRSCGRQPPRPRSGASAPTGSAIVFQASRSMSASGGRSAILETRIGARSTSSLRCDQGKTGARFMSARHVREPLGVGRQADVHDLLVGADRQERTAVGLEEIPDTLQNALDGRIELVRLGCEERGGRVGDQGLELETVLELFGGSWLLPGHQGRGVTSRALGRSLEFRIKGFPPTANRMRQPARFYL